MTIAGGRRRSRSNQIGERILGLPRDPLIQVTKRVPARRRSE